MGKWNISHRRHGKARCLSLLYLIGLRWNCNSLQFEPKDLNSISVIDDRYFMIATVPAIDSVRGEGTPCLYRVYLFAKSPCWF